MYRFCCSLCTVLITIASISAAAGVATFNREETAAIQYTSRMITADLNGDGIPDLIQTYSRIPADNTFSVQIATGDGTFAAPVRYALPIRQQTTVYFATADVNNDGKADIILINEQNLLVYLGNGDGTLAAPKSIPLPDYVQTLSVADFNHDGKIDVALTMGRNIAVMYGDGQGKFSAPVNILTVGADRGVFIYGIGDFDSDANADIAFGIIYPPCNPSTCDHTDVHILYGNGSTSFTDKLVFPGLRGTIVYLTTGDVNGDGRTDLTGLLTFPTQTGDMIVLYGHPTRTLTAKYLKTSGYGGLPVVADVNGDGRNDVAMTAVNGSNQIVIGLFLGGPNNSFTWEEVLFGSSFEMGTLVVGDFNRDQRPDLAVAATDTSNTGTTSVYDYLNTTTATNWSPCSYPKAPHGINVCSPANGATVKASVHFKIAASWFEPLRKIEVWVDGKKIVEQHHVWDKYAWLKATHTFAVGTHHLDVYSAGNDNALQHQSSTFTMQ
ncbi:MAG: hypothetical protein DMG80_08140 [Acidobacteria bacterium]|nr:MAG: hypothetical protein DMG80_08140 [Acidobacteriota bacterium]